jgi:hypothetical protein
MCAAAEPVPEESHRRRDARARRPTGPKQRIRGARLILAIVGGNRRCSASAAWASSCPLYDEGHQDRPQRPDVVDRQLLFAYLVNRDDKMLTVHLQESGTSHEISALRDHRGKREKQFDRDQVRRGEP